MRWSDGGGGVLKIGDDVTGVFPGFHSYKILVEKTCLNTLTCI